MEEFDKVGIHPAIEELCKAMYEDIKRYPKSLHSDFNGARIIMFKEPE